MQEMTMIERVAREIYRCDGAVYGTDERMFDPFPFDELDEIQVAGFMDRARAAIGAMREPTDGMVDKAVPVYERDEYHMSTFHCLGEAYKEMIDAALSE